MSTRQHINLVIRALVFYSGMLVSGILIGAVILVFGLWRPTWSYALSQMWCRWQIEWLRCICGVDYQVSGWDNVPDEPVVILAKHQSAWETLFLHSRLPPVAWVLKRELLWIPLFGWAMTMIGPIAINRKAASSAISKIIEQGQQALAQGRSVVVFPEGTRSAPGQRGRYKLGGARLAARSGYPVVPIAHNAGEFWRRQGFIKTPGTVHVVVGPLIPTQGLSAQQINQQAEEWIEQTMLTLPAARSDEL